MSVRKYAAWPASPQGRFTHHFPSKEALLAKGFSSLDGCETWALAETARETSRREQRLRDYSYKLCRFLERPWLKLWRPAYQRSWQLCRQHTGPSMAFTPPCIRRAGRAVAPGCCRRRFAARVDSHRLHVPPFPGGGCHRLGAEPRQLPPGR